MFFIIIAIILTILTIINTVGWFKFRVILQPTKIEEMLFYVVTIVSTILTAILYFYVICPDYFIKFFSCFFNLIVLKI